MRYMMMNKGWMVKLTGVAALAMSGALAVAQQYGPPQGGYQGQYQGQYDDQHWGRGPQGYSDVYHEQQGQPMMGARQGWAAGLDQGQSDRQQGHSYRPTHVDTFKHVPKSPSGYPRDLFAQQYRDAFMRGYARGYGR